MEDTIGSNVSDISKRNRQLIIKTILNNENITRTELSEITDLTLASISKIVRKLVDTDLVLENRYVKGKSGRRSIGLKFNYDLYNVIGVKLSRQYFKIVVCDFSGKITNEKVFTFQDYSSDSILKKLISNINQLISNNSKIIAVGVAVPGPFNEKDGRIELITTLNDFYEVNIKKFLVENITLPVFIWHDANAAVVAVQNDLNNKNDFDNIAYYYLDQGVGSGIIIDNNVIKGEIGTAGEIGHISIKFDGKECSCGNYGCLEKYASSIEFINEVKSDLRRGVDTTLNNESVINIDAVFKHGRNGDSYSLKVIDTLANYIAGGAINLVNAYNPSVLILDGELLIGKDLYKDKVIEVIKSRMMDKIFEKLSIVFLDNSKDYVLAGATQIAINESLNNEEIY